MYNSVKKDSDLRTTCGVLMLTHMITKAVLNTVITHKINALIIIRYMYIFFEAVLVNKFTVLCYLVRLTLHM